MQIPFIKLIKRTSSKIDQAKTIIRVFCVLTGTKLSETENTVLAYFIVYGLSQKTKELILKARILKTENSLKNALTKFRGLKLFKKHPETDEDTITPELDVTVGSTLGMFIKIDNS